MSLVLQSISFLVVSVTCMDGVSANICPRWTECVSLCLCIPVHQCVCAVALGDACDWYCGSTVKNAGTESLLHILFTANSLRLVDICFFSYLSFSPRVDIFGK